MSKCHGRCIINCALIRRTRALTLAETFEKYNLKLLVVKVIYSTIISAESSLRNTTVNKLS